MALFVAAARIRHAAKRGMLMKLAKWVTATDIAGVATLISAWLSALVIIFFWAIAVFPLGLFLEIPVATFLALSLPLAHELFREH